MLKAPVLPNPEDVHKAIQEAAAREHAKTKQPVVKTFGEELQQRLLNEGLKMPDGFDPNDNEQVNKLVASLVSNYLLNNEEDRA